MEIESLIEFWRLLNLQIARVLEKYPTDRWQIQCDSKKQEVGLHTVEWLAQDYIVHLQHHLDQIRF